MVWWRNQSAQPPAWNLKAYHAAFTATSKAQIEQGVAPWQQPWKSGARRLPENLQTGTPYLGGNAIYLSVTAAANGYTDTRWATYTQIQELGGQVRPGEKATHVLFYKFAAEREAPPPPGAPGHAQARPPMLRVYAVFHVDQADGLTLERRDDDRDNEPEWKTYQTAERLIQESGVAVTHVRGDRAVYHFQTDRVTLPEREQFPTGNGYYQTALHELGHATGHPDRLDRDTLKNGTGQFGSVEYAREELRAEMAALLTGDRVGVGHDGSRGAAYVKGWVTALDHDPNEVYKAAADAQHISDYLLRSIREREPETEPEHRPLADTDAAARRPQIRPAPPARPLDTRPLLPAGADGGPRADDRHPAGEPQPRRARRSRAGDRVTSAVPVPTVQDRAGLLAALGWSGREAEWLTLVALHSGVFTRSQFAAFFQEPSRVAALRLVRALIDQQLAIEDERAIFPGGARAVLLTGKAMYRALGIANVRHRRGKEATTHVLLRRLLSLDYLIERPTLGWLPTEADKVQRFEAFGIARETLPYRKYGKADMAQPRYFALKLPIAVDAQAATFVYVDPGQSTDSELRAWGAAHAPLWAALRARTFAVHVVAVGMGAETAARAATVLKHWTQDGDEQDADEPAGPTKADPDIRQELARIEGAFTTGDPYTISALGGLDKATRRLIEIRAMPEGTPTRPTVRVAIDRYATWNTTRLISPEAAT